MPPPRRACGDRARAPGTSTGHADASSPLETAQTAHRSWVTIRSGASAAISSASTVYSDRPSRTEARTASSISTLDMLAGSIRAAVTTGLPITSRGQRHSSDTPTSQSISPRSAMISVALGRNEQIRTSPTLIRRPPTRRSPAANRCVGRSLCRMAITPHIVVQGADRAAAFYRDAFGAEELSRIPTPDGRLMSVQLRIGDGLLHLADEFPELGVLAPPSIGGTATVLALDVPDAESVFAQAVAAGAEVRQPLTDMFWGDLHGQLDDPFGHRWNIAQHLRDVPHDEIVAAAAQAFAGNDG